MNKLTKIHYISFANLFASIMVITVLQYTLLMVVFGGIFGAAMGSAEMAGAAASGGLIGGLISIVVALPIGWIGGIIYAFIINLALKVMGGSRLKCSKLL